MLLLLRGDVVASDPDWWARAVGAAGFSLAAVTFTMNRLESRWKRRYTAVKDLRQAVDALTPAVRNPHDPRQVETIFTQAAGFDLETLTGALGQIPDRQFERWLHQFVTALEGVRSIGKPDPNPDGSPGSINPQQVAKLAAASKLLDKITKRMNRATKKGRA